MPLFRTWVGTVLAYYFSRENFESAADKTERLIRQITPEERLASMPVTDVMTRDVFSVSDLGTKVQEVLKQLEDKKFKRLPILQTTGVFQALLYREGLASYLVGVPQSEQAGKTLANLLEERPELNQTPAFVSDRSTLAGARDAMDRIDDCKVVLVTKSGDAADPVLGLLTNTDIAKHARI